MSVHNNVANVNISLYDGEFNVTVECVGVKQCAFASCSLMPPNDDEDCYYSEYGSCKLPAVHRTELDNIQGMINEMIVQYDDEEET